MSVNNNPNIVPAENPFDNLDNIKESAGLFENETAVLSKCNYENFKTEWQKGLNNISDKPNTHIRNVKEVKEGIFRRFGAAVGFVSYEPWKHTDKIFDNWKSFDSHVRFNIKPETYQKIAKANPQYFDKVIEHLEKVADDLDKRANVRLGTFVSNQSGETLAMLANDFRSTAAFLRLKMKGDDAAKPGNNNANPGSNQGQPTVINHYHNNIGHIGDINIGHLGDNNFHNKGGNMGVMFKESSNGIPHTSFKSEYSVSKPEHLFYSPTINGKRFLDLTSEQVVQLALEDNKDKGKKLEPKHNEELRFKAEPLPKEKPKNIKQQVDSINLGSEEPQQLYETKRNLKTCYKKEKPAELQQSQAPKEAENINSVQPKQTPIENCNSKLRKLRTMFFANWDAINKDLKNGNNTEIENNTKNSNFEKNLQFFNKSAGDFENEITSEKVIHEIKQLQQELNKAVEKKQSQVDGDHWSSLEPLLSGIELMLSKDKTTAEKEIKDKREKSENLSVDKQEHGIGFSKDITQEEIKNAQDSYQKQKYSTNELLKKTLETIEYIRTQAGLKKKITNPSPKDTTKAVSPSKHRSDVKGINVQQKSDQLSKLERMKQFSEDIKIQNKNLKKIDETKEESRAPSVQDKMKEYDKNFVAEKLKEMKTDNTFDASKNNWNTTNKFQTDASGNKGITFNSGIQKQLNQLNDPIKKF